MYTGHTVFNTNISNPIPNERMNKTDSPQKKKKMPKEYMAIMFKIFSPRKCKSKTTVRNWRDDTVTKRACSVIMLTSIHIPASMEQAAGQHCEDPETREFLSHRFREALFQRNRHQVVQRRNFFWLLST